MKKCIICGTIMEDNCSVCPTCKGDAASAQPVIIVQQYSANQETKPTNGLGIAGMVIGIISYVFCWIPVLNFILGLIGVILSSIGLARREQYRLNGCAIAGLVLSIIGFVVGIIMMIIIFAAAATV